MKFLRSLFLENALLKLLALAIAISLVMTKRGDRVIRVKKMVSLDLQYPDDRVLISVLPPQIELSLEGPYGQIRKFEDEREDTPFKAYQINFNGSENGIYNFQRDYYALPRGLKLDAILPSSMVVRFDAKVQRQLPISALLVGKLPKGYRLKEQVITPDFVTISGAQSVLDKLDRIETLPVQLAGRTESGAYEIGLRDPPLFAEFTIDSPRVNLRLEVEELIEERVFENVPIVLRGDPGEQVLKITPSRVSVSIKGPQKVLTNLKREDIEPYVEVNDSPTKELQVVDVKIEPIQDAVSIAINPNKVSLLIPKLGANEPNEDTTVVKEKTKVDVVD